MEESRPSGAVGPREPAFGDADLSNCEREQIQYAASIQPHGALVVVSEPDHEILQNSLNAADIIGLGGDLIGLGLRDIPGDLSEKLKTCLTEDLETIPVAVRCHLGETGKPYDCVVHRSAMGALIIELEPAGAQIDLSAVIGASLEKLLGAGSFSALCDEAARVFRDITGYDRVMVYRFDEDGHGSVISEEKETHLEAYLGNRYPASDIPLIARRLYERNRIRILVDVEAEQVPIEPRFWPESDEDLDMSLCSLRSMSPIHVQYLRNMGVRATLVASLVVSGKLWGLIACHHYAPRTLQYEMKAVCELLSEVVATRIAGLESFARTQAEISVRRIEDRMIETISRDGDWRAALFDSSNTLLQCVDATGAALVFDGQVLSAGIVPGTQDLMAIADWLDSLPDSGVLKTATLGIEDERFAPLKSVASGVIATPVSNTPGEYLIWFRPEQIHTVTWGGNPFKPVEVGNDPADLSPRRSFSQWHQSVSGSAVKWSPANEVSVHMIGASIRDVVIQFRSVSALIAREQLEKVGRQVSESSLPVAVFDLDARLFLVSKALKDLLGESAGNLNQLTDLAGCFAETALLEVKFAELVRNLKSWRGEVALEAVPGQIRPLLVRADPIVSSPNEVLGFVVLFIDLSERRAAEYARQHLQEKIIDRTRVLQGRMDSHKDLTYRKLMSSIVENAQLAAMDIADGVDVQSMPEVLETIEVSIDRASELLVHLVLHAEERERKPGD